jgi:hypothetical protein
MSVAALAQAHAEDRAWAARGGSFGVSFKQGHRTGWRDGIEWVVRAHRVQWEATVLQVWPKFLAAGIDRSPRDVDNAIQSAREALHADDAVWFDPDTVHGWEALEPHVLRFLDLADDELAAVAA